MDGEDRRSLMVVIYLGEESDGLNGNGVVLKWSLFSSGTIWSEGSVSLFGIVIFVAVNLIHNSWTEIMKRTRHCIIAWEQDNCFILFYFFMSLEQFCRFELIYLWILWTLMSKSSLRGEISSFFTSNDQRESCTENQNNFSILWMPIYRVFKESWDYQECS